MGVAVAWDYAGFLALFPEFTNPPSTVTETQLGAWFGLASTYHRNDGGGLVGDATTQFNLMSMITAHLATLLAADSQGNPASPVVGRISSFSEGSASGGAEYQGTRPAQWYLQTKYGAMYWEGTAQYRTAFYTPGRRRSFYVGPRSWPYVSGGPWS